jgi:glucose-6-phosphate isomerase
MIKTTHWNALTTHSNALSLFTTEPSQQKESMQRSAFHASASNIHLDYSHQRITPETLTLLFSLAESCDLRNKIHGLMRGDLVNVSERRPALHTALRASDDATVMVEHKNIMPGIVAARKEIKRICDQIRDKQWLGYSGEPITDVVNIGIGGSDLGPRFALKALDLFATKDLGFHFISDCDPASFRQTVSRLRPETTLFIISSKSFTTPETLYNAKQALAWVGKQDSAKHFIAVTAHPNKARAFGINTVLPLWDWIGGRYSFCSAINLITAIAIGYDHFAELLAGANSMDKHFEYSPFESNLPVLLALLGIWNNNFLHLHQLVTLTYSQHLDLFVPFIQQLDMESNGKSIDLEGKAVLHATGPLIFGGSGNQAQHSYYQWLCQGTHKVAADIISLDEYSGQMINTMSDNTIRVLTKGVYDASNPNAYIPGQMPLNHIRLEACTPYNIGALVALYEHKIVAQSFIWNINPFDQQGVESAKSSSRVQNEEISNS